MTANRLTYRRQVADMITIPHDGDMVSWADGKLRLPYSVRYPVFMASESPWLLEPMRAMSDPKIRRVDFRAPAGAAKSLVGEVHIAHSIVESHGLYYYVWQTDEDAKDALEDRIMPMIEANECLKNRLSADKDKTRRQKIVFPGFSFYCISAKPSKAQSKRVKDLVMEEPHLYDPGMMTAFEKRVEGVKNPKILTLSTGSIKDDESDVAFNAGSCSVWQVPCPHCGEFQVMTDARERLLADTDETTTDANGDFMWNLILPTVRYNCEHCEKDWPIDELFRKEQSKKGKYVATNPNAPEDHLSFHLEAASVYYFPLSKLFMEKLNAVMAYKRGAIEPFKDYIQKRRAMAWDDAPTMTDEKAAYDKSKGEYNLGDPHEFEISRFMTVDNQAGKASKGQGAHRWVTCRSFGPTECRLIHVAKIITWEEVEELRIKLGVESGRVLVDIAFDTAAVQAVCVRYGWQGLWGDTTKKDSFPHHDNVMTPNGPKQVVRQLPYSRPQIGHVGIGKSGERRQARYYWWAQRQIKDMWHRLKNGMTTYRWTVAKDTPEYHRDQTNVEYKKQVTNPKTGKKTWEYAVPSGKDNHLTDTDQMCLVAAIMDPKLQPILWTVEDSQPETENEI